MDPKVQAKKNGVGANAVYFVCRRNGRLNYKEDEPGGSLWLLVVRCNLGLNTFVNLFTVHRNILRSVDSEPDLKALHAQNGDSDFVTDVYAFADFAGEYQHNLFLDGLLKRLYQEAGVSLWVVVIAGCIQMRPSVRRPWYDLNSPGSSSCHWLGFS